MYWVWLATSAIAGPAYVFTANEPGTNVVTLGKGVIFQSLWGISLTFLSIFGIGWIRNFFSYVQDFSIWIMPFSISVFSLNTLYYYTFVGQSATHFKVLWLITLAMASAATAVAGLHTVTWIIDMSMWKPKPKWLAFPFVFFLFLININ
jgi:hypothetical protein